MVRQPGSRIPRTIWSSSHRGSCPTIGKVTTLESRTIPSSEAVSSIPVPLSTDYPHAGILNTTVFLRRYPTTATNRNRARSRWTYYHFLGLDVEKSASRTTDPVALADTVNPTMRNPACTVCHRVLDPVAGAFQNYGDLGYYKDQWGGMDSLDELYKEGGGGTSLEIRADSWRNRETLSWPVSLAAGVETLGVLYTNQFWDEGTGEEGAIYLDRLSVTDAQARVLASHEFEDLELPSGHSCGEERNNPITGRNDHLMLWAGDRDCALIVDIEIPRDGVYDVEIVAWSIGQDERYEGGGYARLVVVANPYQEGDTWYGDMRPPGFADELAPNPQQQRAVVGSANRERRAIRRGGGQVLVAGDHGQ